MTLNASSCITLTVDYSSTTGTATASRDYTAASGTLTFAPSQTALNISIPITNDATAEPNKTVNLTLSSPTNATIGGTNPATLTIVDNDGGSSGSDEYEQYDALGNLLQKGATAYTYGASASSCVAGTPASKPHAATSAGAASYAYDCDGNILSGGGRTGMLWDTENRLTSVTNSGVTETYGYDADGERLTRTTGGTTTVYLGGLWEETSAGAVKQYYPFNGTVVVVRDSSAGVSYIHGDHLGSVSATTGATSGPQTYGPWGNVTSGGSSATARNYTGQYLDSASGLLYYHARYYDATLARFISADTQAPNLANPQDLNPYSYVRNNPLTFNDPMGHCASNPEDMDGEGAEACAEAIGEAVGGEGGKPPECYRCNTPEYDTPGARAECYTGGECGSPMDAPNQSAAAQARAEEAGEAGNLDSSTEPHHVYEIERTNNATGETSTWKYGISSDPVSEDLTTSRRLHYQVSKLNNSRYNNVGGNRNFTYRGRILAYNIPDERLALEMEHGLVDRYAAEEQIAGRDYEGPPDNKLPKPVKPERNRYLGN